MHEKGEQGRCDHLLNTLLPYDQTLTRDMGPRCQGILETNTVQGMA